MNQTMNDLALLCIGLGLGFMLSIVAVMVYVLWSSARKMQHSLGVFLNTVPALRDQISGSIDKLRGEVSVGLGKMDAERLYSTSLQLQRLVKSLTLQVDTMQRALFAQPPSPALDFTAGGMTEEAEDDARMIAERNRWQQPANQPPVDPLTNLTEAEKAIRVQQFFEKRRQEAATAYATGGPGSDFGYSSPPAAGSGAYSSLLDEANQRLQPAPPPADFSGLEPEEGIELAGKGELE